MPVGPDAYRWRTFPAERTVAVVARTVTSLGRVLDVLPPLLRADQRVDVVFAYDPTSAFNDGVRELLRASGARVLPWDQLGGIGCHLIVTATENADLSGTDCPVLVLPHGIGFHKLVPDSRSADRRLSGLVPPGVLDRAWLAISHPDQADQLAAAQPRAAERAVLIGDPCYDRLAASVRWRARYREALGVTDGRRLVLVSSTWAPQSLLGRRSDLPARLAAGLPLDEYRVALVSHPNVWSAHGAFEVGRRLDDARDAGLLVVPAVAGWQAALVAADAVVGDHGSVTLYAAALGKPVLLAEFGSEAVPGTPLADLGRAAPRLDPDVPLREQVERAVAGHDPAAYAKIADRVFAEPGRALELLRSTVYRLIGLAEPDERPRTAAFPPPEAERREPASFAVMSSVTGDGAGGRPVVAVERFPATAAGAAETEETFRHLAAYEDGEPDLRVVESASVLVRGRAEDRGGSAVAAVRWIREVRERLRPRLAAAPVDGGCLVGLRDGGIVEATATGPVTDPVLLSAVVYARLRAGLPPEGTTTLRVGGTEEDVVTRLRPTMRRG